MTFLEYVVRKYLGKPQHVNNKYSLWVCPFCEKEYPSFSVFCKPEPGTNIKYKCFNYKCCGSTGNGRDFGDEYDFLKWRFPLEDYDKRKRRCERLYKSYEKDEAKAKIKNKKRVVKSAVRKVKKRKRKHVRPKPRPTVTELAALNAATEMAKPIPNTRIGCKLLQLNLDFKDLIATAYVPENECGSMSGMIGFVQQFIPAVHTVSIYSGEFNDVVYFYDEDTIGWHVQDGYDKLEID